MHEVKVAYEVSVLGITHLNAHAKTGVSRVVERIAAGLAAHPDCNLAWCVAQEDIIYHDGSQQYVRATEPFSKIPMLHSMGAAMNTRRATHNLYTALNRTPARFPLGRKVANSVIGRADRAARMVLRSSLSYTLDDFDIFHSPFYEIPPVIRANKKVNKFLTVYDLIPMIHPEYFNQFDRDENAKKFAAIDKDHWLLCISEATRADLCHLCNVDPAKVFVTPLAADPDNFYPSTDPHRNTAVRQKYAIPDSPYVLSVATLEPRKNIRHVIDSFVRLISQQPALDLNLVLVGAKGWLFDEIFASIGAAGDIARRIIVTGRVADEDLAPLYSGAAVFVYPSHYEGFGLPPLEAMQCGLPVITSNNSSLPEVVGDAGIMIDANDSDALCQNILTITQNPALRASLSARGLERAKSFSWENCVQKTLDAYRTSLS